LKMERTLAEFRSQAAQRNRFIQVMLNVTAYGFHHFRLLVATNRSWTTTQAGTVAGFLGFIRLAEECDIFPARTPRGAGGAAINSS
jgi:hypothetical protein